MAPQSNEIDWPTSAAVRSAVAIELIGGGGETSGVAHASFDGAPSPAPFTAPTW